MSTVELENSLAKKIGQRQRKQLRTLFFNSHPSLLNFSSLDFLALLKNDFVRSTAIEYVIKWGAGSFPSRPMLEYTEKAAEVANKFASLLNKEAVLLLETYPDLFSHIIQSLIGANTTVWKSRCFTPIIKHSVHVFDADRVPPLENALSSTTGHSIVCIDSLEAGNLQTLKALIEIAEAAHATIIVDDTFSFGMFGKNGVGLSAGISGIDLVLGNFGKSFGSYASYFACSKHFMNYILYHNPSLFRITPLPPLLLGAVEASLHLIPSLNLERREVLEKAAILNNTTHLLSLGFAKEEDRKNLQRDLTDHNFLNLSSTNQLQFSVTHSHTRAQLLQLAEMLKAYRQVPVCEAL